LVALYTLFDAHKEKLPQFVAANPLRFPSSPPAAVASSDISVLTALVHELRDRVAALTVTVEELRKFGPSTSTSAGNGLSSSQMFVSGPPAAANVIDVQGQKLSFATQAAALASNPKPFIQSTRPAMQTTRVGKRLATSAVKAVPRPLVCFVGRLDPSTTAESLHDYLEEAGIMDAVCMKLVAKNGRTFHTAAFRVSCSAEYRELFYNEDNWPEGAELRDWFFTNRNGAV